MGLLRWVPPNGKGGQRSWSGGVHPIWGVNSRNKTQGGMSLWAWKVRKAFWDLQRKESLGVKSVKSPWNFVGCYAAKRDCPYEPQQVCFFKAKRVHENIKRNSTEGSSFTDWRTTLAMAASWLAVLWELPPYQFYIHPSLLHLQPLWPSIKHPALYDHCLYLIDRNHACHDEKE